MHSTTQPSSFAPLTLSASVEDEAPYQDLLGMWSDLEAALSLAA